MTSRRIRVLLVDDHPSVLEALARTIADEMGMECVGQASTPEAALDLAKAMQPDAAVVDVRLGDADGIELVRALKGLRSDMAVVLFSMYDSLAYGSVAARAGAAAYLTKRAPGSEVIAAIRHAVGHDPARRGEPAAPDLSALSDRERSVLDALSDGLTTAQTASKLGLSAKTIATYRARIVEKLSLPGTRELRVLAANLAVIRGRSEPSVAASNDPGRKEGEG